MSSKWGKAPIFYMIAQVRFGAILKMADFVSSIQSDLRHDFPDFSTQQVHQIELQFSPSNPIAEPKTTISTRWDFKNITMTEGYILTASSLSYHTTNYVTSEEFVAKMLSGLEVVNSHVELAYVEGIGMRSLDAVVPSSDSALDKYLTTNLRGLYGILKGQFKHSIFEAAFETEAGRLVTRAITLRGKLGVSADLVPFVLAIRDELQQLDGLHVVLDNDCVQSERMVFDQDEISKRLRSIKRVITESFTAVVTDEAVAEWKGKTSE